MCKRKKERCVHSYTLLGAIACERFWFQFLKSFISIFKKDVNYSLTFGSMHLTFGSMHLPESNHGTVRRLAGVHEVPRVLFAEKRGVFMRCSVFVAGARTAVRRIKSSRRKVNQNSRD